MLIALLANNKLAFIDGSCRKPNSESDKLSHWERWNGIDLSLIMNAVSNEIFSEIVYLTYITVVWSDLREDSKWLKDLRTSSRDRLSCSR